METKTLKERVIKDSIKISAARYGSQAIGFFSAIAMRRYLGPFNTGIWGILKIFMGYLSYAELGITSAASVKIPFFLGKNDQKSADEIKNTAFTFSLLISILTSLGLVIASIFLRHKYSYEVIIGLNVVAISAIIADICGYYMLLLKTNSNFRVLSIAIIFDSAMNLFFVLTLVSGFKLCGLYLTITLVPVINIFFIYKLTGYKFKFSIDFKKWIFLIKTGFPLSLISYMESLLRTVDSLMIAKMISITAVGYYGIGIMSRTYVTQLTSIGTVLKPLIMQSYGKEENVHDIKKFVTVSTKAIAYLLAPLLGVIFILTPTFINFVLPKFAPGIIAMQILLLDTFFRACLVQSEHFLVALSKQNKLVLPALLCLLLDVILNYKFIKMGLGINGVAWGTSISTSLYVLFIQYYAMIHFWKNKQIIIYLAKMYFSLVYTVIMVMLLGKLTFFSNIYFNTLTKAGVLIILYLPLFLYINNELKIAGVLLRIIKSFTVSKLKILKGQ